MTLKAGNRGVEFEGEESGAEDNLGSASNEMRVKLERISWI